MPPGSITEYAVDKFASVLRLRDGVGGDRVLLGDLLVRQELVVDDLQRFRLD
jgi:hypothetical protein